MTADMTADITQEESLNEPTKLLDLGAALRKRREHKGLELEDIALRIKVSAKNLRAIEAGSQEGLPQPVFTRGFIRSYAQVLEMDREEVESLLREAFPDDLVNNINAERTTDAREQSVGINSPVVPRKLFAALGLLLLLGAIGAGVWLYLGGLDKLTGGGVPAAREAAQRPQAPATPPAGLEAPELQAGQPDPLELAEAEPPQATSPAPPAASPATAAAAGQTPEPAPASELAASERSAPPAESAPTAVSSTVVRTSGNPPSGVHQVQINVTSGRSWIGIQADNANARNFELRSGSSYRLEFRQKATVTIGNAAGVQVTYNGQRVPFTAREGEVKVLRFPPAG